eukprot:5929447-Pyramimonas_sp.AAC.1
MSIPLLTANSPLRGAGGEQPGRQAGGADLSATHAPPPGAAPAAELRQRAGDPPNSSIYRTVYLMLYLSALCAL